MDLVWRGDGRGGGVSEPVDREVVVVLQDRFLRLAAQKGLNSFGTFNLFLTSLNALKPM